jgi:hypothetical protein
VTVGIRRHYPRKAVRLNFHRMLCFRGVTGGIKWKGVPLELRGCVAPTVLGDRSERDSLYRVAASPSPEHRHVRTRHRRVLRVTFRFGKLTECLCHPLQIFSCQRASGSGPRSGCGTARIDLRLAVVEADVACTLVQEKVRPSFREIERILRPLVSRPHLVRG